MTRHYLTPKNPQLADVVLVGYDRMLSTFYTQVYKRTDDDPTMVVWEGDSHGQLPRTDQVIDLVRDHAYIPDELWYALDDDRFFAPGRTSQQSNAVTHWSTTGRVEPAPDDLNA